MIAEARAAELTGELVDPVDLATAQAAMAGVRRVGRATRSPAASSAAPTGRRRTASGCDPAGCPTVRTPSRPRGCPTRRLAGADGVLPAALVWAALDCPGGWSSDLVGRPMVLGRITAAVDALPAAGDPCVVVGRHLRDEGRKTFTASTAYDGDGRVLGRAEALWIALRTPATSGLRRPRLIRCDRPDQVVAWRYTEGRWSELLSTYRTREVAAS